MMTVNPSRRQVIKGGVAMAAASAMAHTMPTNEARADENKTSPAESALRLPDNALTHGGVQQILHPELGVPVTGQTSIRYLRFGRPVVIDRLELGRHIYGRWIPDVPVHPAHLLISRLDARKRQWQTIREIDLPADDRISGKGLSQAMSIEEMNAHFARVLKEPPYRINLDQLATDHLRVICDREHPVWPNHGECNGGLHNVPFGILNTLSAYGTAHSVPVQRVDYRPVLKRVKVNPQAPKGMKVFDLPDMLLYESKFLSIGFSLTRPMLMHLEWSIVGKSEFVNNRLLVKRFPKTDKMIGGASGPILRTLQQDYPPYLWSGEVTVDGNRICYQNLRVIEGFSIDAVFTVHEDHIAIDLTQSCQEDLPVIEAEAWRMAWDLTQGITGIAGVPTCKPGRNGDVTLPAMWASDGNGCLACERVAGDANESRLQVESYRPEKCVTSGFVLGEHPGATDCQVIPAGKRHAQFTLALANFEPEAKSGAPAASDAVKKHWATVFSCFRPEYRGFSNHSASVNCHLSQGPPIEIATRTRRTASGLNPNDLARFTIGRALLDGGGYGYHRNLYLDSDPILLAAAGRIHQADPDMGWLKQIETGIVATVQRILGRVGSEGLVVCKDLSGNSGSYRWSTNSMDVIGFGHIDAYVNAWAYRGLRNAAAILQDLVHANALARQCREAAKNIRDQYAAHLLNPQTKWIAGWRSRDGKLHDYAFLWVNGVALAFGLVDETTARSALQALEQKRAEVGPANAKLGLPCNLLPIREDDHMLAKIAANNHPTFETYTDGSLSGWPATYYLRALSIYGLKKEAQKMADELQDGYVNGIFNGGDGTGHEFRSWEGLPTGYEGTLIGCFGPMYGIAIETGLYEPLQPEWWPANG
jgi:hypothetical protein